MNLHGVVSGIIPAINPLITITITASIGYTTATDGTQTPSYATPVTAQAQVQALTTRELAQVDAMNIQGNLRKVWLNGNWNGIVRQAGKGGDLLTFGGKNWLVEMVLEQWPDWTSVVVSLQNP